MKKSFKNISTLRLISIFVGILILVAPVSSASAFAEEPQVEVMSRNLYLGANIFAVIEVALAEPALFPEAVAAFWATVKATEFETRAKLLPMKSNAPNHIL